MFEEHFDVLKPGAKKPKKNNLVAPTGHANSALLTRFYLLLQAYAKLRVKGLGRWTLQSVRRIQQWPETPTK